MAKFDHGGGCACGLYKECCCKDEKPPKREMKPIPISAAEAIAKKYGYDQVYVYARRVGEEPDPCGEHLTTYGIDPTHCGVAARVGKKLMEVFGWAQSEVKTHEGRS